ncbi:MAG: hypothetical protein KKB95_01340 [Gammaproteobacteria bacterium]|nr:hypothetical protein [Gammaproteobacteria bacterium]MBU1504518.1 hypothetical protein [Gammaproteobacteria bacterium]MBU2119380.1 hypothetical protein [Gammaproteobacteria bacterium]MBU2202853.1 hypothetical protein [Gammaproteobacteria bacterium]MBU2272592.1 hypothetical protein [Gammaproteobacteria bacterium]
MSSTDYSYIRIRDAVRLLSAKGEIQLLDEIIIPEANVLLCKHGNKRFNINIDVIYGVTIEPVDLFSQSELESIESLIDDCAK